MFKQLFPQILPYGATRFRAHEAFDLIGQEISWYSGQVPRTLQVNTSAVNLVSTAWNYRTDADINYEPFDSWPQKYGPHEYGPGPDNFTSIIRWNLSDVLTPENSGGIYVSGYLERSNITQQPFAPENIVIVYDGCKLRLSYLNRMGTIFRQTRRIGNNQGHIFANASMIDCASTCTIFSELMRQQGGVKTIALGGRPNKDIIQAVGGVKGTNDFPVCHLPIVVEIKLLTGL